MTEKADDLQRRLDELAPEARRRVEQTLKETIERELASSAAAEALVTEAAGHEKTYHEKTGHDKSTLEADPAAIREISAIDDEAFAKFTERLTRLKEIEAGGREEEGAGGRTGVGGGPGSPSG